MDVGRTQNFGIHQPTDHTAQGEKKKGEGEKAESSLEDGQFGDKGDCIRHWAERTSKLKDKMVQKPKKRKQDLNRKSNTAGRLNADGRWGRGGRGQFSGLNNRAEVAGNFNKNYLSKMYYVEGQGPHGSFKSLLEKSSLP